jgi:hypothetical protein
MDDRAKKREQALERLADAYDPAGGEPPPTLASLLVGVEAPPPSTRYPVRWSTAQQRHGLFLEELENTHLVKAIHQIRRQAHHRKQEAVAVSRAAVGDAKADLLAERPLHGWLLDEHKHYRYMLEEAARRNIHIADNAGWASDVKKQNKKDRKKAQHVEVPVEPQQPNNPSKRKIRL